MQQSPLLPEADGPASHLFFALCPDAALRESIVGVVETLELGQPMGGRALHPDRHHLTLQYLGEFQPLPPSLVEAAKAAATKVCVPGFELLLDQVGSFPGSRVGWLGPRAIPQGLSRLWHALDNALASAGVQVRSSAAFKPHLTIRRDVDRLIVSSPIDALRWPVRDFVLIESRPGRPCAVLHRQDLHTTPSSGPQ
jgi:2'-5' RNA ligase